MEDSAAANRVKAVVFDWAGTAIDFGSRAPLMAFLEMFKQVCNHWLSSELCLFVVADLRCTNSIIVPYAPLIMRVLAPPPAHTYQAYSAEAV